MKLVVTWLLGVPVSLFLLSAVFSVSRADVFGPVRADESRASQRSRAIERVRTDDDASRSDAAQRARTTTA